MQHDSTRPDSKPDARHLAAPRSSYRGSALERYHQGLDIVPCDPPAKHAKLTSTERTRARRAAIKAERDRLAAQVRFHEAKRRAAKLQRTPPWADLRAMRGIYAEAQRLTRETGIPHHVDHKFPLQGKLVSGLHVPDNLQILTSSENSKKRNRFEIEL